jgi:hypothetical protein
MKFGRQNTLCSSEFTERFTNVTTCPFEEKTPFKVSVSAGAGLTKPRTTVGH